MSLLKLVTTVPVHAVPRFVAADAFEKHNPDGIKFFLEPDFRQYFLGKVEEGVPAGVIALHALKRDAQDAPIMAELGDKVHITLAHFYQLIKAQAQGQAGPMFTNGCRNIAYIVGDDGNLWAVSAYWHSNVHVWFMDVQLAEDLFEWNRGDQVLSQA